MKKNILFPSLLHMFLLFFIPNFGKTASVDHTQQKELAAYSEREKKLNRELYNFSKGKDFNERNLYDLLLLLELEITSIDYLLSGPKWHFRQVVAEKDKLAKKATPTIKKIFKCCINMAEQEGGDLEQGGKDEYLRGVRTSLKRAYAKAKALEEDLKKEKADVEEESETIPATQGSYYYAGGAKVPSAQEVLGQQVAKLAEAVEGLKNNGSNQPHPYYYPPMQQAPTIIQVPMPAYQQPPTCVMPAASAVTTPSSSDTQAKAQAQAKVDELSKIAAQLEKSAQAKKTRKKEEISKKVADLSKVAETLEHNAQQRKS